MVDEMMNIGKSVIHHGRNNQRIYVLKSASEDMPGLLPKLDNLATKHNYTKIFAKAPVSQKKNYLEHGFQVEATVPNLFHGKEAGLFLGKYLTSDRANESQPELVADVLEKARDKQGPVARIVPRKSSCRPLLADDMNEAAQLYRQVFASYPFPIDNPDYLRATMDHIIYYGVWHDDMMVALASAEIDFEGGNAEMTDFATLPEFEGKGFAGLLLARMEVDMKERRIPSLFTIARAYSYGMNITFARNGYHFSGTLTNNTQISGQLESMNVWYKLLPVSREKLERNQ